LFTLDHTDLYTTTMSSNTLLATAMLVASASAFTTSSRSSGMSSKLGMTSTVDPTTVTTKEYEDVCGVSFKEDELKQRLSATKYLYPRHVEVIEDIAPIAGRMVDDIVSIEIAFLRWVEVNVGLQSNYFLLFKLAY